MIKKLGDFFILETAHTTYAFRIMDTGQLEHLYYGKKITLRQESDASCLIERHAFAPGNTNQYQAGAGSFSLEDVCLEMSSYGKGDIREPFLEVVAKDGSTTSDFIYSDFSLHSGKEEFTALPGSYDESGKVETLRIVMKDRQNDLKLVLSYFVYEECDVITRASKLVNEGKTSVRLERLLSTQLDFPTSEYIATTFTGGWVREMRRTDHPLRAGKLVNASFTGSSSNRANPFVCLARPDAGEETGEVYGMNLIYSGNHMEVFEVASFGKLRFLSGINPQGFSFVLDGGEKFEAPEAVLTFSAEGFSGMSRNMHEFVRKHIVRGYWRDRARPVLLNSWEASYFDISERKLLKLAKAGRDVGIELFVMDDGWFLGRNDDTSSLGDWEPDPKKLPDGLKGICNKVNQLGLSFGIWVEPEMVNVKSRLYEKHPDWTIEIPGKPHSEGRNQRILDLTKKEVQDFLIEEMSRVFSSAKIEYVKWDMNRTFTDCYSNGLPPERQGEVFHRYILGLYRCLRELMAKFPKILFEGCAAGGNRFDLGMLCYFPQIWGSDDTDALCRAEIQYGYSFGYPLSTVTSHVSSVPNHQTLRISPLDTRYAVAGFGVLGYELNLCDLSSEELKEVEAQISTYKAWREVYFFGDFYRGRSFLPEGRQIPGSVLDPSPEQVMEWTVVSKDRKKAVGMLLQKLVVPNTQYQYYRARGLSGQKKYHFYNMAKKHSIKSFGDLVNTASPVHIRQNSLMQEVVSRFVKMDGEREDYEAYGDTLMNAGVKLKQGFSGTGYSEEVRFLPDFGARLYYMEEL